LSITTADPDRRRPMPSESASGQYLNGMVGTVAAQVGELVQAAATGDEPAFTELVSRHHQDMLRVA
jgi:hypothetical protein